MKAKDPLVSIIVPTYNSSKNINIFLESFLSSEYKNFEIVVNDDARTNDNTEALVRGYANKITVTYIKENKIMAQARKQGASHANGDVLIHLDSDMKVTPGLLGECIDLLSDKYDALVIPEEAYGTTFWAKCKWLEKKCYEGDNHIESLRCIKSSDYQKMGGHDERMIFSEDKDFDIRARNLGLKVGRTKNFLYHNEGDLKLLKTLKKKLGYSNTADLFAEVHPEAFRWQANILNRYILYAKNSKYLLSHPFLYIGMIYMKTCEFAAGAFGLVRAKITS